MTTSAALVLAAGSGTRFGATKQLATVGGLPMVAHVVATALEAGIDEVVLVLGHDADRVGEAVPADRRVRTVPNQDHVEGLGSSLRVGAAALGQGVEVAVVLLADQPGVSARVVRQVVAAAAGHDAARAVYDDGPGHPVAFARHVFGRLAELGGDVGARELLGSLDVAAVPVEGPAPPDVDRPDDLDGLRSDLSR